MEFESLADRPLSVVDMMVREPGQEAPIDLAYLRRFTLGERAIETEVLQLFAEQTPDLLARLAQASTARAWFEAAHTLKGSARAIGAHGVARLAEAAERLPEAPQTPKQRTLLAELEMAVGDAVRFARAQSASV